MNIVLCPLTLKDKESKSCHSLSALSSVYGCVHVGITITKIDQVKKERFEIALFQTCSLS